MILSESNGVGVTLTSLKHDSYDLQGSWIYGQIFNEEGIIDWFESNYLPAFSSLQHDVISGYPLKYSLLTIEGVDDNDNPVEATIRIDYLPK